MSNNQKSPYEDVILFVIVIGLIFGIGYMIWRTYHNELKSALRWVRVYELKIVQMIEGDDVGIRHPMYGVQLASTWENSLPKATPQQLTKDAFIVSTQLGVLPLRNWIIGLLGVMMLYAVFRGPQSRYRRRMTLEILMGEQSKNFPTITPFLKFNPLKLKVRIPGDPVPADLPLFAEALTPEEWVAYHEIPMTGKKLEFGKAFQALYKQLGERWKGPLKLPIHAQGIYAACALKHIRKRDECDDLLNQLAMAWTPEKGFRPSPKLRSRIRSVIKDKNIGGKLLPYTNRHAYEATALLRALQRAREEGGILAPAQFVWLRGHDRALWYPLNNLGRKAYHAEATGAMTHFTHELVAGQRIPMPRFDETIKVLEEYVNGPASRGIPKLDRGTRKKK